MHEYHHRKVKLINIDSIKNMLDNLP